MKYFILLMLGGFIGYIIYEKLIMPNEIKHRIHNLGFMKYDGKTDKFIIKDSILIRDMELYYLIHGTTKIDK